jgi:hypothetical protein
MTLFFFNKRNGPATTDETARIVEIFSERDKARRYFIDKLGLGIIWKTYSFWWERREWFEFRETQQASFRMRPGYILAYSEGDWL